MLKLSVVNKKSPGINQGYLTEYMKRKQVYRPIFLVTLIFLR